ESGVPEARNIQPIYSPLFAPVVETFRTLTARPGLMFVALMVALALFWLVV
ncbi:MAG: flagella biosynthesis regulator Flk, partial [Enterobacteriaceae bacterium]